MFTSHLKDCILINSTQGIVMSPEDAKIDFKNYHKQLPAPFVIYADFEAVTEKIDSCLPSNEKSYMQTYQSHQACSFGYKVVCHYDRQYSKQIVIYQGDNAIDKFIMKMFEEVEDCKKVMKEHFNKPLRMTLEEEKDFKKSTKCHICDRNINLKR